MKTEEITKLLSYYQENDPTNNEVYNLAAELAGNLIKMYKWNMQPIDFDNVTHDIAADVYNIVSTKRYEINNWGGFVHRMMKLCYIPRQRKSTKPQVFDMNHDPVSKRQFVQTFVTNFKTAETVNRAENRLFFKNIGRVLKETLDNSKFANDMSKRIALEISVALSLRDNKIVQFHTTEETAPYVNILVAKMIDEISKVCNSRPEDDVDVAYSSLYASELFNLTSE